MTATVLKQNLETAFICSAKQAIALLISGYAQLISAKPFTVQLGRGEPGAKVNFIPANDSPEGLSSKRSVTA